MKRILKLTNTYEVYRDFSSPLIFLNDVKDMASNIDTEKDTVSIMRSFIRPDVGDILNYPMSEEADFYGVTCYSFNVITPCADRLISALEDTCYGKYLIALRSRPEYTREAHTSSSDYGEYRGVKRLALRQPQVLAVYAYADDEFGYWHFRDCVVEEKAPRRESPYHYFLITDSDGNGLHYIYPTCEAECQYLKRQFANGYSPYNLALRFD